MMPLEAETNSIICAGSLRWGQPKRATDSISVTSSALANLMPSGAPCCTKGCCCGSLVVAESERLGGEIPCDRQKSKTLSEGI